jgi:hypothetical protein
MTLPDEETVNTETAMRNEQQEIIRVLLIDDLPSSFDILMDGSPSIVYGKRFPGTTPCWITKKWMFPME